MSVDDLRTLIYLSDGGAGVVFAPAFAVSAVIQKNALQEVLPGWKASVNLGHAMMALTLAHGVVPDAARALVDFVRDDAMEGDRTSHPVPGHT